MLGVLTAINTIICKYFGNKFLFEDLDDQLFIKASEKGSKDKKDKGNQKSTKEKNKIKDSERKNRRMLCCFKYNAALREERKKNMEKILKEISLTSIIKANRMTKLLSKLILPKQVIIQAKQYLRQYSNLKITKKE